MKEVASPDKLLEIYKATLLIRKFEEAAQDQWEKGLIPGLVHLSIGEEAVAAGACAALKRNDYIVSTHRPHGHYLAKGGNVNALMAELFAKSTGCCGGRGGSMHLTDPDVGYLMSNAIVGSQIPIASGVGLSIQVRNTSQVCVCFLGDGALSTGAFHEAVNLATIWRLPVIFICENNQYANTVPFRETTLASVQEKALAYRIQSHSVDGMDAVAVYESARESVTRARTGEGPTLLGCETYRFCGHSTSDPSRGVGEPRNYRTTEEIEQWEKRDPVILLRRRVLEKVAESEVQQIESEVTMIIANAVKYALESPEPDPTTAMDYLFLDSKNQNSRESKPIGKPIDCITAIRETLRQEMRNDERIVVFGEDMRVGSAFGQTKGLMTEFGKTRVRDTPISEIAVVGTAIGAAMTGLIPVVEIQIADMAFIAMDQIANHLAKLRYVHGGRLVLPVVVRLPCGTRYPAAGWAAQHTQSMEGSLAHIPGLKVVTFSTPYDAKGLLTTAIRDKNPTVFLEHKLLYFGNIARSYGYETAVTPVPDEDYRIPFGKADIKREGRDLTIVATMLMVHKALRAAMKLQKLNIDAEVIDPRTLVPLDRKTIIDSIKETGRLIVVTEDNLSYGVSSEIASLVAEEASSYLKSPVKRLAKRDVPNPYSPMLEGSVIPQESDIVDLSKKLMERSSL